MSIQKFVNAFAAMAITLASSVSYAQVVWIPANRMSCENACDRIGLEAVPTGIYSKTGRPFHICSFDVGAEGLRPGFNAPGYNDQSCVSIWGQQRRVKEQYNCMCDSDVTLPIFLR